VADPTLDWAKTHPVERGRVFVPLDGQPDVFFARELEHTLARFKGEARGQQWDEVHAAADGILIEGLQKGGEDHLKRYLSQALERASARAVEERALADREATQRDETARQQTADDEEMTRHLREGNQ
jgi:hypothetical protein